MRKLTKGLLTSTQNPRTDLDHAWSTHMRMKKEKNDNARVVILIEVKISGIRRYVRTVYMKTINFKKFT
jgi:hypothetical protein